jgi:ADP-heptose:LPS heptosyltransferase
VARASGLKVTVLAGQTSLKELAQLMARASLAVGVDSGPMHMAVALGVPTLQLYGPTDPALYGPWGDPLRHRFIAAPYPCHPCGRLDFARPGPEGGPCMLAISPDTVVQQLSRLLEAGR